METIYSDVSQKKLGVDPLVYNIEDIEQSIDNILVTTPSERFFLPEFGCNMREMLFELATSNNTFRIFETVRSAILKWEKRVKISNNSYFRYDRSQNVLVIHLEMEVPALNIKNYVYARSINISKLR